MIGDALGNEPVAVIVDLDAADCRHRAVVVVIDQRIGLQQHLRIRRDVAFEIQRLSIGSLGQRAASKQARQSRCAEKALQTDELRPLS
ncbi:hypothetical protein MesoLjLc_57330 [Mesorhizobium sp. L-8-10]|nr:hypothetical protein MesoLjLc_57330 [Mesorhizobium sp. L-8-10]